MMGNRKLVTGFVTGLIVLAVAGFAFWYHGTEASADITAYEGTNPKVEDPAPETLPTTGLVRSIGWGAGEAPRPAPGLAVSRFAEGLNHPRTLLVLPNGDMLVAETNAPASAPPHSATGWVEAWFKHIVSADVASPDTIILLRDAAGSGHADRFTLRRTGLHSPSGMAYVGDTLYIADHDAVLAFAYHLGDTTLTGDPVKVADLPAGGNHWMRGLVASQDGKHLFVAVGSASNIAEHGIAAEKARAGIWEIDLGPDGRPKGTLPRPYAAGLRNPNGMAWNPSTGELWTVVNERDMLGPNLVPDYLTNVPIGAHYGWPWVYWKDIIDERVTAPMPDYLTDYTRKPEYALGPHVAPLGLVFAQGGARLGAHFANGAFVARHGSWNRRPPVGYDVVFVRFDNHGNPTGLPEPVLTGFLASKTTAHGRPVWLGWAKDGALLVSDDTAGVIWRVIAPGAAPSPPPPVVVVDSMPPQHTLKGDPNAPR